MNPTPPPAAEPDLTDGDRALMRRAQHGDADAMNELLRRFWPGVVAFAQRFTDSRDAAQDIAQEVFLRLWQRRLTYNEKGTPRSFLYGVTRNLIRDQGRRWREVRVEDTTAPELPLEARAGPRPLEQVEEEQLQRHLFEAVSALPARRQEIFNLARVHGLSHREIADALGISIQTVANQMSAALTALRDAMRPWLD